MNGIGKQDRSGNRDRNEGSSGDGNVDRGGNDNEEEEERGERELGVALAGSQRLRTQDSAPVRRCTDGRTGPQGREGGNGDGNRDGDGDGKEDVNRDEDGEREGLDHKREWRWILERREGCWGERARNLRSDSKSGAEDAREEVTPTNSQQPQPKDPTPHQELRFMRRTINRPLIYHFY